VQRDFSFVTKMRLFCPFLALLAFSPTRAPADAVKLRTLAGKTVEGELVNLSSKEVVVRSGEGPVAMPLAEVLDLEVQPSGAAPAAAYADVELTDGSRLHCAQFTLKGSHVEMKLVGGTEVRAPLAAVSYVLQNAQDAKTREEWQGVLAGRGNQDLLAIRSDEKLNTLAGTFGAGDDEGATIEFETTGGVKRRVALAKLHGMSFLRTPAADAPAAVCRVHDTSKNLLAAADLTLGEGGFAVKSPAGAQATYPVNQVHRLDFSQGKLAYLSDLEPKVVERSAIDWVDHYRRDKGLDGGPLRLGKDAYSKGLALHAYAELTYDLGGRYKEFKAVAGVDPQVGGETNAKLVIEGDGRPLYNSVLTRKAEAQPVTLNVSGVKQLRIVVSSDRLLGLGDHVNLVDAKVSK
jgi:hypothetical protein